MTDTEKAVDRVRAELRTAHREQTGFLDALWDFEAAVRADTKAKCEAAVRDIYGYSVDRYTPESPLVAGRENGAGWLVDRSDAVEAIRNA